MTREQENPPAAVSNTGPLISAFQSDSLDLLVALFGPLHTSETCLAELTRHGWGEALAQAGASIISHRLRNTEQEQAKEVARRIAAHPASKDKEPEGHLGEAEAMVLAQREEFADAILLLDELAARAVAENLGLVFSGFAGVLLLAVAEDLLTSGELKDRLERCRNRGTHYSTAFIEKVYQSARGGKK